MHSINRAAILVRPKSPYLQWARSLEESINDDQATPVEPEICTSVYLVEVVDDADFEKIIRRNFNSLFEEQLGAWHLNMDAWPDPRTFSMFQEWFETEVVDLVYDLSQERIEHDD